MTAASPRQRGRPRRVHGFTEPYLERDGFQQRALGDLRAVHEHLVGTRAGRAVGRGEGQFPLLNAPAAHGDRRRRGAFSTSRSATRRWPSAAKAWKPKAPAFK